MLLRRKPVNWWGAGNYVNSFFISTLLTTVHKCKHVCSWAVASLLLSWRDPTFEYRWSSALNCKWFRWRDLAARPRPTYRNDCSWADASLLLWLRGSQLSYVGWGSPVDCQWFRWRDLVARPQPAYGHECSWADASLLLWLRGPQTCRVRVTCRLPVAWVKR